MERRESWKLGPAIDEHLIKLEGAVLEVAVKLFLETLKLHTMQITWRGNFPLSKGLPWV